MRRAQAPRLGGTPSHMWTPRLQTLVPSVTESSERDSRELADQPSAPCVAPCPRTWRGDAIRRERGRRCRSASTRSMGKEVTALWVSTSWMRLDCGCQPWKGEPTRSGASLVRGYPSAPSWFRRVRANVVMGLDRRTSPLTATVLTPLPSAWPRSPATTRFVAAQLFPTLRKAPARQSGSSLAGRLEGVGRRLDAVRHVCSRHGGVPVQ